MGKVSTRPANSGFTLVELIVTITILGLLLVIAVPSFKSFTSTNAAKTAANDLVTAFNLARVEAISRGQNVSVCKSATKFSCATTGDWSQGWIVFTDADGDGTVDGGAGDTVLRVFDGPRVPTTMSGNIKVSKRVTYASSGFFAGGFNGTITVTSSGKTYEVITSTIGRVRINKP